MMMHDVGVMGMRPEDPFSTFSCEPVAGFSYTWAPLVLFFFSFIKGLTRPDIGRRGGTTRRHNQG